MEFRVTFNKVFGIIFLVLASLILYISLLIGPSLSTISGLVLLVVSVLYLVSPAVVYSPAEIQLKNLLGMTLKKYSFESDTITVKDQRIYVNGSKINLAKGMLAKSEYNHLLQYILTRQLEKSKSSV